MRRQRGLALACALSLAIGGHAAQGDLLRVQLRKTAPEDRTAWRSLGGDQPGVIRLNAAQMLEGNTDVVSLLNFMDAQASAKRALIAQQLRGQGSEASLIACCRPHL